jgi:hypothetical protein
MASNKPHLTTKDQTIDPNQYQYFSNSNKYFNILNIQLICDHSLIINSGFALYCSTINKYSSHANWL